MSKLENNLKFGWLPDLPDLRDYTVETGSISTMVDKLNLVNTDQLNLQVSVDLRKWCSPIEDQGNLGSCTAHAAVGLVEYFERRAFNKFIDGSRLFLYKVTRNLLGWTGDTGAYTRATMGALALLGLPPEKYYPYVIGNFDNEPNAFCYSLADNYKALKYFRLDSSDIDASSLLKRIKSYIAAGIPSMFGFTVYQSIVDASGGQIPFPSVGEQVLGGHAIDAVGYDDHMVIQNPLSKEKTIGALLIRNSWGETWGEKGYGWLPYDYVLKKIATDWWVLLDDSWIDTGKFGV